MKKKGTEGQQAILTLRRLYEGMMMRLVHQS